MVSEIERKVQEKKAVVAVVGLGYVGYALADAFSKHFRVIGFDISEKRLRSLEGKAGSIELTNDPNSLEAADFNIICVPTPVTRWKEPDLSPVRSAAKTVGLHMGKGAVVVLESTVYPGVTEDVVIPILEEESKMKCGRDFKVGYSPERVNPGDANHELSMVRKIVSGMDEETTSLLASLYGMVTTPYKASSIKVAESAKAIENIQRDINIALMNEFTLIFQRMGLDTKEIIEAAGTKWNFVKYSPGMVGGHCIPVDPYYLVYKARELDYHPQVILAGRAINDFMPKYVAEMAIKGLNEVGKPIKGSKILIMGLTYKENVPDVRESPSRDLIKELQEYKAELFGYDPLLSAEEVRAFGVIPITDLKDGMDCVIITVAHDSFKNLDFEDVVNLVDKNPVIIDVRGMFKSAQKNGVVYRTL